MYCYGVSREFEEIPVRPESMTSARWLTLADAVPADRGNIRCATERQPGAADVEPLGQGLLRGEIPEFPEHQVVHQGSTERRTELVGNGSPELAQAHRTSLSVMPDRFVLALNESRVEVCDEIVGDGIGDDVNSLDDCEAIAHLTHYY